jgi:hypothetical protein
VKDEEGHVVYQMKETRVVDNVWRLSFSAAIADEPDPTKQSKTKLPVFDAISSRIRCLQPANAQEWVGYQTQKPVDLIERVTLSW